MLCSRDSRITVTPVLGKGRESTGPDLEERSLRLRCPWTWQCQSVPSKSLNMVFWNGGEVWGNRSRSRCPEEESCLLITYCSRWNHLGWARRAVTWERCPQGVTIQGAGRKLRDLRWKTKPAQRSRAEQERSAAIGAAGYLFSVCCGMCVSVHMHELWGRG